MNMKGKPPMMRADLEHIIKVMPETYWNKARDASLMIFALQAGMEPSARVDSLLFIIH